MNSLPERLQEIIEDFSYCQGREKLEYLMEFAEALRPLPNWLQENREQLTQVQECMSPVFIHVENSQGNLVCHFEIPLEAPTVRGYGALLQQGLDGITPDQMQEVPNKLYLEMGLEEVMSSQRLNGITALLARIKQLAQAA